MPISYMTFSAVTQSCKVIQFQAEVKDTGDFEIYLPSVPEPYLLLDISGFVIQDGVYKYPFNDVFGINFEKLKQFVFMPVELSKELVSSVAGGFVDAGLFRLRETPEILSYDY